ncbi:hypothetical protein LCGC14_1923760 [marine sediment metagenome]|uniref:Uncharacterized protein n=1 Tax=marine sediment metagenome TaxID=412755 RepID=A0A0F9FPT5_9ZZZZ
MTDKNANDKAMAAALVAEMIGNALSHLHNDCGLPAEIVFAGAHACIVSEMAMAMGGTRAAESCMNAARAVEGFSTPDDAILANTPTTGRA